MLNKSGISKETLTSPTQILASVQLQYSVGVVVGEVLGVEVGSKKIAKAGTPIKVDLSSLTTPVTAPTASVADSSPEAPSDMNAVLLHDVDVTSGDANGTALLFGFVNINRLESDVASKVKAGTFGSVTFLKA